MIFLWIALRRLFRPNAASVCANELVLMGKLCGAVRAMQLRGLCGAFWRAVLNRSPSVYYFHFQTRRMNARLHWRYAVLASRYPSRMKSFLNFASLSVRLQQLRTHIWFQ